jgi:hypothetical protein
VNTLIELKHPRAAPYGQNRFNEPIRAWCMIRRRAKPAGIAADVDRLVHHATIFEMNVESYRRRAILEPKRGGDGRGLRLEVPPAG